MKKILIVLSVVVLVVLAGGATAMVREFSRTDKLMAATEVNPSGIPDLIASLQDGKYTGEFHPGKLVGASVELTVAGQRITAIDITEHNNMKGKPAETIIDTVVATQSLDIDIVSGATFSSKVILVAIENAIRGN